MAAPRAEKHENDMTLEELASKHCFHDGGIEVAATGIANLRPMAPRASQPRWGHGDMESAGKNDILRLSPLSKTRTLGEW
jgi:hypothetical protein